MGLTPAMWTDRCVYFTPSPRQRHGEAWEAFFDALPEHYWERPGWVRRFVEPGISSCDGVVQVSGLPWWLPMWWSRRTVTKLAMRHGLGGHSTSAVERISLP